MPYWTQRGALGLLTCAGLLLAAPQPAAAQNRDDDQPVEVTPGELPAERPLENSPVGNPEFGPEVTIPAPSVEEKLKTEFRMSSEIHGYENLDMRALDEVSDQEILNSDDRHTFAYSSISALLHYQVRPDLLVHVGVAHNGLWSEDQLGQQGAFIGALNFFQLDFDYTAFQSDAAALTFQIGRQPFRIGGVPTDYMLDDILDAAVVDLNLRQYGHLRWLAVDFFQGNDLPNAAFVRYVSGRQPTLGLRGDTYTLRTGLAFDIDVLGLANDPASEVKNPNSLTLTAYWFYADVGGGPIDESGADVSFGGALGNFSDNDFTQLFGARAAYALDGESLDLTIFGEFAQSTGIDRKETVARDVETVGAAFGGGVELKLALTQDVTLTALADFYSFDGADYAGDGLEFERGFVSFRGRRVGGLNINRYAGWFPSATLGSGGIEHAPQDLFRAAGLQFLHGGLAADLYGLTLRADLWLYTDTATSFLDLGELDTLDPPFGYSREEFFANTARAGKALGTEINVQADWDINDNLEVYGVYGVFLPGDYYQIEIDRVANADNPGTTALGSTDPQTFWAATGGARVKF
jgi:hypothetical protein